MEKNSQEQGSANLANLPEIRNQLLKSGKKEIVDNDHVIPWFEIEEKSIIKLIVETFIDHEMQKILNLTTENSLTRSEILKICKFPRTTTYRIVNSLEKNGLLIKRTSRILNKGRKQVKYRSIFENVKINIEKGKISVKVKFSNLKGF